MPLVDLDAPEELRARWSALAAVAHATGFDRRWYADEQGWYHQDETGSDLRMVMLDAERSVLFGLHTEHSRTAGSDLLAGSPGWIGQPEVQQRIAAGRLGFVYGSFGGTWARAAYLGDPWQPLDDGFLPIASWLTSDEEAAEELIEWAAAWADYLGALDELRPVGIALIRTAATTGITSDSLVDLFDRLRVGPHSPRHPDLGAALIAAEQFGGPNAGRADRAAVAGVDDEPMETIVVPPGVSPFTGQVIKEEPAPSMPPPRVEEYGTIGRNQPAYEEPTYEQDYEVPALARLGLIGPDPVDEDDETGEIEMVPEEPPQVPRVGGEVEDGEDYYASLFADAPAAATYLPDVASKPHPVREAQQRAAQQRAAQQQADQQQAAQQQAEQQRAAQQRAAQQQADQQQANQQQAAQQQASAEQSWQLDESTREFFPFGDDFDDDTAAQPAVTEHADRGLAALGHQPEQQTEPSQRDWVGGAWVNGEWVEDAATYLAARTTNAKPAGPDLDPPPSNTDKPGANAGSPSDAAGLRGAGPADALSGPSTLGPAQEDTQAHYRNGDAPSGGNRADGLSGPGDVWSDGEQDAPRREGSPQIATAATASPAGLDRAEPPSDERFDVEDAANTVGFDPEEPDSIASPASEFPDDAPTAEIAAVLDVEADDPSEALQGDPAPAQPVEADEEEYYPTRRSPFAPDADWITDQLGDVAEADGPRESARAEELVVPPPSTPPIAIPGLGLVAAQAPRVEPAPGSLEEAMRAEQERPRPRPKETPALQALRDWCRARTKIVPSGFTIQIQVLDPAAPSYRFDLEPPEVHDPEYAADRLADLLGELWLAEAEGEQGGWLFARLDAAGRTLRIDRWYDQVPDWWDNPVEPRLDVQSLVRRLYGRGVDWQPDYLQKLHTDAR